MKIVPHKTNTDKLSDNPKVRAFEEKTGVLLNDGYTRIGITWEINNIPHLSAFLKASGQSPQF